MQHVAGLQAPRRLAATDLCQLVGRNAAGRPQRDKSLGLDRLAGGHVPVQEQAPAGHRKGVELRVAGRLDAVAEGGFDAADALDQFVQLLGVQRRDVVGAGQAFVQGEMLFQD